jgi:hypothetical protein
MNLPSRLAKEGEILVTHKFFAGPIGFASPEELSNAQLCSKGALSGSWIQAEAGVFGLSVRSAVSAVCIPPGARLKLLSISDAARAKFGAAAGDEVVFTQITAARNRFRDALRIGGKHEVLLQSLGRGLEIQVVSLTLTPEPNPQAARLRHYLRSLRGLRRSGSINRSSHREMPHWSTFIGTW